MKGNHKKKFIINKNHIQEHTKRSTVNEQNKETTPKHAKRDLNNPAEIRELINKNRSSTVSS